jgi:hypothetical protein
MANTTSNPNRISLATRIAAERKTAVEVMTLKQRVASAWTLAKTMLPTAPAPQQLKVAQNLLLNTTPVLTGMLRQAAVNAHFTHVAEEYKVSTGRDLNDDLPELTELTKAKSEVTSELKGEAKNASAKVADDTKECGEQPATYDEGKRTEPADMDGDGAADRPKQDASKEAAAKVKAKTACSGKDCKGCAFCKKDDKKKDEKKDKKEASASKTAAVAVKTAEEEAAPEPEDTPAPEEGAGEGAVADDTASLEGKEEKHEEGADEAAAEGKEDAVAGDDLGTEGKEDEVFDEEKATLQDAIDDVQKDVEVLQTTIEAEIGDADDINLTEEAVDDGAFDAAIEDGGEPGVLDGLDGMEVPPEDPNAPEGEELNIEGIFSDDNIADKVSALKDEGDEILAGFEDFFDKGDGSLEPSAAADMEGLLDQEEGLRKPLDLHSPADYFAMGEGNEDNDPMHGLFASAKTAAEGGEILKPGTLDSHFETSLAGDDRNDDTDHEGDIFSDVLRSLKPEPDGQTRVKQDSEPELKTPEAKAAAKKAAGKTFPKLATHFDPMAATKIAGGNLANLIFGDEADFQ